MESFHLQKDRDSHMVHVFSAASLLSEGNIPSRFGILPSNDKLAAEKTYPMWLSPSKQKDYTV